MLPAQNGEKLKNHDENDKDNYDNNNKVRACLQFKYLQSVTSGLHSSGLVGQ
jgi:hypothetical protein